MQINNPDPKIVCDRCGKAEAESESAAETEGWLVGYEDAPRTHICPVCREATE